MNNFQIMLRNWKTTLLGVLPTIATVAIMFGWIDLEQQEAIVNGVKVVFESADSILNEIVAAISAISGIGLLFSKDADKSSKSLGI